MHSRGYTWTKMAPEYGSVITNSATFFYFACYGHGGFAKIDLSLTRRMRQRQEDFPPRELPLTDRLLDAGITTAESVLVPQSLPNPLGCVSLLLGRLSIILHVLLDDRQETPPARAAVGASLVHSQVAWDAPRSSSASISPGRTPCRRPACSTPWSVRGVEARPTAPYRYALLGLPAKLEKIGTVVPSSLPRRDAQMCAANLDCRDTLPALLFLHAVHKGFSDRL